MELISTCRFLNTAVGDKPTAVAGVTLAIGDNWGFKIPTNVRVFQVTEPLLFSIAPNSVKGSNFCVSFIQAATEPFRKQ